MSRITSMIVGAIVGMGLLFLGGCALTSQGSGSEGTSWGQGVFTSNGERIYFTATSDSDNTITYTGGPSSNSWMMMNGRLACASCHGPDGRGGEHMMGMMVVMNSPDIRWSTLEDEFDAEKFTLAIEQGQDPDGSQFSTDMPRWKMSDRDVSDLIDYLKTLP